MKLIALPDLHGRTSMLTQLGSVMAQADWILLPGDVTNGSLQEAHQVLGIIRQHNPNILAIPGNMDNQQIDDYFTRENLNVHGDNRVIDGVAFLGVGGALPFYGRFVFEEPELADLLKQAVTELDPQLPQVLLCHQPPLNTVNDIIRSGKHAGSQSVREFIEHYQPILCFTGHIHVGTGIDRIGQTHIINPGPLWESGHYAWAEIENGAVQEIGIRSIPV